MSGLAGGGAGGGVANVLSVAGSDPSGGAGIQADLKAFAAAGAYGMAAITALTAQNTLGVRAAHAPPAAFLAAQIDAVFDDVRVDAVKIGMLATAEIAAAAADALARGRARQAAALGRAPAPIVLDPVMIATSGDPLLDASAVAVLRARLAPMAAVLTPNLPEAAQLLGAPAPAAGDRAEMARTAAALLATGAGAALLKGGHLGGADSPDALATPSGVAWLEGARIGAGEIHGGGCALSAALAARLAQGRPLADAAREAKAYVARAIAAAAALDVGGGARPLHLSGA